MCAIMLILALLVLIIRRQISNRILNPRGLPYPPGPPSLPLIGNLLNVPSKTAWLTYTEWKKQYGDLIYMNIFGMDIVIINSLKIATDLLEKKSHIYSDRPKMPVLEFMGWDFNVGLIPYGEAWRHRRTIMHRAFRAESVVAYRPVQMSRVHHLLQVLLETPHEFQAHIKNFGASILMETVYGHQIAPRDDRLVTLAEETVNMLTYAVFPGAQLMNAFPILQLLPAWFPGAGFKRIANKCSKMCTEMQTVPFQFVKEEMAAGTAIPSLTRDLLEEGKESESIIKAVGASAFAAGADTSVAAVTSLILAMILYPEVQKNAQDAIDNWVGSDRLPTWEDREALPYIEALCRELLRWQPITPLGVAHAVTESDIYDGYFLPKGATVIANTWAMTRDERMYQDPHNFNPANFLAPDGRVIGDDAARASFGFGRRICVGRPLGDATVWLAVVSILSVFSIGRAKDDFGVDIPVFAEFTDGIACHPLPFCCSITPRSAEARELILESTVNGTLSD